MIVGNGLRNDLRRSISLFLVVTLICGICVSKWTGAAEQSRAGFSVEDMAKAITIFKDLNNYHYRVGVISKYVYINSEDKYNIEDHTALSLTGEVFYCGDDEKEYKMFSYRSSTYNGYDPAPSDSHLFFLTPVFYDNDGNEITGRGVETYSHEPAIDKKYGIDQIGWDSSCGLYGFHPDFINYMKEKYKSVEFNQETSFEQITSAENACKLCVKYTLSDDKGNVDTQTVYGYTLYGYNAKNYDLIAQLLNYSRIEDMSDYHGTGTFNEVKMYKGDLYTDADKIGTVSDITIPNYNKTNLYHMNSMELNNADIWDDGGDKYTITKDGWNIYTGGGTYKIFPDETLKTYDEAKNAFCKLCCGNNFEKFISEFNVNYSGEEYENAKQGYENNSFSIEIVSGDDNIYNISKECDSNIKVEYYTCDYSTDYDLNDEFRLAKIELPYIPVADPSLNITSYKNMMSYINRILSNLGFNEVYYRGVYAYSHEEEQFDIKGMIEELDNIINSGSAGDLIGFEPVNDIIDLDNSVIYNGGYIVGCIKQVNRNAGQLGIESGIKGYFTAKNSADIDSSSDFESYMKENNIYEDFMNRIVKKGIISHIYEVSTKKRSQEVSEQCVVDSDSIKIPLKYFNQELGQDNIISRNYYVFPYNEIKIQKFGQSFREGTGLYHGTESTYGYETYEFPNLLFYNENYEYYGSNEIIPYSPTSGLYHNELTNLKFAKVPDMVESEDEYCTTDSRLKVKWSEPNDNGAEIVGYQVAVVPKGEEIKDSDWISDNEYKDLGDIYTLPYTTSDKEYDVNINEESKDVYVRAINVIGTGEVKKLL